MKNLIKYALIIITIIAGLFYWKLYDTATDPNNSSRKLYVYNWGEYIDPESIELFEEYYKIDVVYEMYDSNETLYTKIITSSSPYDVVFPSEYMVDKLNQEGYLTDIDFSKITNYSKIDPRFLTISDGNKSVPYFWGTVGIIYNETLTDLEFDSWDDLWDPSLKENVILVDGAREILGLSLQSLGYSLNSTDPTELRLAQEKLFQLRPNVKAIIGDEILQLMPSGEAAAAVTWSGSARDMQGENEDLVYAIPNEGTNIWVDSAVIPTTSTNRDGAHQFIDFLMDPTISYLNSEYVGYSTPNLETMEMFKEDGSYIDIFYPDETMTKNMFFYINLSKKDFLVYNDLFLEFKMF